MPSFRHIPIATVESLANGQAGAAPGSSNIVTRGSALDGAPASASRRRALKLMAASAALAGSACSGPPQETIVPYVQMPEQLAAGQPLFYASAFVRGGYGHGVLVESNMGRPTKVEGNLRHPSSRGATDIYAQASILQLWDPDRSQAIRSGNEIATWIQFEAALAQRRARWDGDGGAGLRILSGHVTSPTMLDQMAELLKRYPNARWHRHDPLYDERAAQAAQQAFGQPVDIVLYPEQARVVLCFDADMLGTGPGSVAYARDFMQDRRNDAPLYARRLYAVETCPTLTGIAADHRLARAPVQIDLMIARLGAHFGVCPAPLQGAADADADPESARWLAALVKSLEANRGAALIVAGGCVSVAARAIVHALNAQLGAVGRTLAVVAPAGGTAPAPGSLAQLVDDMRAGHVDTLVLLDANPVYTAPASLAFGAALAQVPCSVHLGLYRDETGVASSWHIPAAHNYEQWSDARAHDGTASIVQPLIAPLYDGYSAHTLMALLAQDEQTSAYALVRRYWQSSHAASAAKTKKGGFDTFWADALQRGAVEGSAATPLVSAKVRMQPALEVAAPSAGLIPLFVPDQSVGAGEFSNNAWLQELPRSISKITWDNAAMLGPRTAAQLGVTSGDVVQLSDARIAGPGIEAPLWIVPGHAEGCITLPLGYGRRAAGSVANGVGFNAYALLHDDGAGPLILRKTGRHHDFACTQTQTDMEGRALARSATVQQFREHPQTSVTEPRDQASDSSLYPPNSYDSYKWGMAIDLNACIGCNVCTIACQAENNIPVVGKQQVGLGRVMHWIRVDRYDNTAHSIFQPVPCMHCENAPCEEVCPVGATVHDSEGLNLQVYNRCVGTRFCSNNCPYKVRRFNFLQYTHPDRPNLRDGRNPEVTVRRRGVMEKCSYCLQRITRARLDAEKLGRPLRDGEVVTACQAACPTAAIVFGDLNDRASAVSRAKSSQLDYAMLAELNTRPRTSYAARLRNPDPELE